MKKILLIVLTVGALSVQAHTPLDDMDDWKSAFLTPSAPVSKIDVFSSTIKAAAAGYRVNVKARMAWRDTNSMIKKAKKLHKAGKVAEAIALAKKAHKQTENAKAQTALAISAGPNF